VIENGNAREEALLILIYCYEGSFCEKPKVGGEGFWIPDTQEKKVGSYIIQSHS